MRTHVKAGIMQIQIIQDGERDWLLVARPAVLKEARLLSVEVSPGDASAPVAYRVDDPLRPPGSKETVSVPQEGLALRLPESLSFPMRVAVRWLPGAPASGGAVNRSEVWLDDRSPAALTGVPLSEDGQRL